MTVARNIAFGMRLRRTPARKIASRVQELLELVNLPGMGERYPHQLSGGQQQRVAVARALATEPRLVLLDEPLSSLDTALRETVGAELVQLFKRLKITTINVTHDQNEAMNMSDRIMVLRDGQVQQIGTPTQLYLYPANAFVAGFMGPANLLYGDVIPAAGSNGTLALSLRYPGSDGRVVSGTLHKGILDSLNGGAALLCRPDDTRILTEEPQGNQPHIIPGVVLHSSFVAGRWRTLITIAEGQEKAMLAFSPTPFEANHPVWLELPVERCQIVPI
jgi:ABC-type Fe3+/spermidine/putrescine transport system ATPase subunit